MFDIGFPELLLVSIVALVVIGPERLPETVRTIFVWLGKLKRNFANIKMEIEQEIGVDEIRQQIHNDTIMKELDATRQQINDVLQKTDNTISEIKQSANDSLKPLSETSTDPDPLPEDQIESYVEIGSQTTRPGNSGESSPADTSTDTAADPNADNTNLKEIETGPDSDGHKQSSSNR